MDNINSDWDKIKLDLIFEILAKNGILSEFNVILDITDKKNYMKTSQIKSQIYKKMDKRMKENKKWAQAYYYLTNNQYSKLPKIRLEKMIIFILIYLVKTKIGIRFMRWIGYHK